MYAEWAARRGIFLIKKGVKMFKKNRNGSKNPQHIAYI